MRNALRVGLVVGFTALVSSAPRAQEPAAPGTISMSEIIDRVTKTESALTARMRATRPIVEVYIQNLDVDAKLGAVPVKDEYFLGQFEGRDDGPRLLPLSTREGSFQATSLKRPFAPQYLPGGFAAMVVPDWQALDRQRYDFEFVRREFLGETRTLVFDVRPKGAAANGFSGRLWIEDRDFNIVRFNGISRNVDHTASSEWACFCFLRKNVWLHVDSWRVNVQPGVWLPSYVYGEEAAPDNAKAALPRGPRVRSQIRLWGYELKSAEQQQEFSTIRIDGPVVQDTTAEAQQMSTVLSQRRWEQQAEENVIDRLARAGFLAPAGPVDRVLETVLNNLEVTNNLVPERPVHVRILLTSPLESFTVGHTVVISRGLIDVLPDESSLAMVLGHELSHVVLGHQLIDTKFAFADRLMVPDADLIKTLRFRHPAADEAAADTKVVELLKNSPYKDKLSDAGLFLRTIAANGKALPNLIQPHMGDYVVDGVRPLATVMQLAPELSPEKLDQIPALPLGARLVVDPWSDRLDLLRTPAIPLASAREKVPLLVTPLMPYLRYVDAPLAVTSR